LEKAADALYLIHRRLYASVKPTTRHAIIPLREWYPRTLPHLWPSTYYSPIVPNRFRNTRVRKVLLARPWFDGSTTGSSVFAGPYLSNRIEIILSHARAPNLRLGIMIKGISMLVSGMRGLLGVHNGRPDVLVQVGVTKHSYYPHRILLLF
jgi:hypothetical protein